MPSSFNGRKPTQHYDHNAIVEMARAMTRRQIMAATGISDSYVSQILTAGGVKPKRQAPKPIGKRPGSPNRD